MDVLLLRHYCNSGFAFAVPVFKLSSVFVVLSFHTLTASWSACLLTDTGDLG